VAILGSAEFRQHRYDTRTIPGFSESAQLHRGM